MQQHKQEEVQRGRGASRAEQTARGRGMCTSMGMGMGMNYGHTAGLGPGFGYGFPMPVFTAGAGTVLRAPMFAQGMGLGMALVRPRPSPVFESGMHNDDDNNGSSYLKRVGGWPGVGTTQSHDYGRRGGYAGRHFGSRGRGHGHGYRHDLLTKEALDADLDEWRMKDKKYVGESLDAELDEYWRKKIDESEQAKSESKDSSELEMRDFLGGPMSDVPKRTAGGGNSFRPSKKLRNT